MKAQISDDKIVLKKYEMEFAPLLYEAAYESRGGEFTRWMPWCHENYTLEESTEFVSKSIERWANKTEYDFAILDRQDHKFRGMVSLNRFDKLHNFCNLGYWIRASKQNQGIASSAAKLLSETAFKELDLNRIEIVVAVENIASQKTAEKAGAKREGVLRKRLIIQQDVHDAVTFSFVREDFR